MVGGGDAYGSEAIELASKSKGDPSAFQSSTSYNIFLILTANQLAFVFNMNYIFVITEAYQFAGFIKKQRNECQQYQSQASQKV